ncbi:MAG: NYN domain-containing protein [Akkermansia sp.]|nr:NYN domain-containing protein [Akkermansia sp.]
MIKTAILVDGGFYRRKIVKFMGNESPEAAADTLYKYCMRHIAHDREDCYLYRVLYYDCAPSGKQIFHPLLKKVVDLKKEPLYLWNTEFLNALRTKRKFAVRLGKLADEQAAYNLTSDATRALLNGRKTIGDLTPADFSLSIKQKGVDTRIGIDLVSMALKKQVDKIVLIAGDSDFVPAAKFVRREGVDFVLDPMGAAIKPELSEHIDGLTSFVATLGNDQPTD